MKDFESKNTPRDNQVIAAEQRQVKAPERKTASMILKPGHKVWEFDLVAGTIEEAKIEKTEAILSILDPLNKRKPKNTRKKIIQREQCLYAAALNKDNALKKFITLYDELVKSGVIVRPDKPKVTVSALEAWLLLECGRDAEEMAIKMFDILTGHPSEGNPVWELLEATGDAEYSKGTFRAAAEIILSKH